MKRDRAKYQSNYRKERIRKLKLHFGGKCTKCGYDKCLDALDFHHIDPNTKLFSLRQFRGRSWKTQLTEAEKCQLVCANCHREIHTSG